MGSLRVALALFVLHLYQASASLDWQNHVSQLGADRWVLDKTSTAQRFYVDLGANKGVEISNTYLLDKMGWRGICIEPVETEGYDERTCTVVRTVVGGRAGEEVQFTIAPDKAFSGMTERLGMHRHTEASRAGAKTRTFVTVTLEQVLEKHSAPLFIDFLSIDTEGSEYDILAAFDFSKYRFGQIAVEHNNEEPKRDNIHTLLTAHGYCRETIKEFDDWYILGPC